jgi:hypothetical protein
MEVGPTDRTVLRHSPGYGASELAETTVTLVISLHAVADEGQQPGTVATRFFMR